MRRSRKGYEVGTRPSSTSSESTESSAQDGGLYYSAGCYHNPAFAIFEESNDSTDTGKPPPGDSSPKQSLSVGLADRQSCDYSRGPITTAEVSTTFPTTEPEQGCEQTTTGVILMQSRRYPPDSNEPNGESHQHSLERETTEAQTEVNPSQLCGCGPWKPKCLQVMARPAVYLICVSALVLCNSLLVAGYLSSILTTIERRYELWSRELGFIISSYDFTAMIFGIIISYLGDRYNRAKWLGRGALFVALGTVVFSLPYFIGGHYVAGKSINVTQLDMYLCNVSHVEENNDQLCDSKNPDTWALALFMVGQMIIGAGAAPIFTLGVTYLYDNVSPSRYAIYAGIMYSMTALGPASGFLLGAAFLKVYVHPSTPPEGLSEGDSTWVGAWWAGILMCTVMYALVALPLLLFPKQLPNVKRNRDDQLDEDRPMVGFVKNWKEFPRQAKKLFTNPTWLFVSLILVMEQSIGTGFNRYIAKYLEVSYNIAPSKANIITGAVIIPGACIGFISGGILMKKMRLSVPGIARFLLVMNIIPTVAVCTLFFLGCDTIDLVGINTAYTLDVGTSRPVEIMDEFEANFKDNLTSACNSDCSCSQEVYEPVCGQNNRTYFSPCHAGCTQLHIYSSDTGLMVKNYSSCACIYEDFIHRTAVTTVAISGKCDTGCYNLIPFLIILFIIIFITCCGQNPTLLITLKCVGSESRSFALGMQNFLVQLIAFIPAPIYFGRLFDSMCILWSEGCDRDGACLEYNIKNIPFALFGTCLGFKFLSSIFILLVWIFTSREQRLKDAEAKKTNTNGEAIGNGVMSESVEDAVDASIATISGNYVPNTEVTRL